MKNSIKRKQKNDREDFFDMKIEELIENLHSEKTKDVYYSLCSIANIGEVKSESLFDSLKDTAENSKTMKNRKFALQLIKRNFKERVNQIDIEGKVKVGFVYFLLDIEKQKVKIGMTTNLNQRINRYRKKWDFQFEMLNYIKTFNYSKLESALHKYYKDFDVGGEWFCLNETEISKLKDGEYPIGSSNIFKK